MRTYRFSPKAKKVKRSCTDFDLVQGMIEVVAHDQVEAEHRIHALGIEADLQDIAPKVQARVFMNEAETEKYVAKLKQARHLYQLRQRF